jgi:flagellar motility protein MotE (MotC chaperone)
MMTGRRQRETWRPRRASAVARGTVGFIAVAIAGIALSTKARAQDGWAPVVAAVVPSPNLATTSKTPSSQSRSRPPLRESASPSSPQWNGLPPLATTVAQTAGTPERRAPADLPEADVRKAREYCLNIADAAVDARFAWQKKTLADLELEIAKRVELLEAKTAEYQKWLARRDEFSKKAQDSVVTIYARMKPDAAAAQLVAMDEETAAAILAKLDPRNASAILNDMEATHAARLTATISGAANVNLPGKSKSQSGDKRS